MRYIITALVFASVSCSVFCALGDDAAPMYVDSRAVKERFSTITAEDMDMLRGKKILLASRSFGLNTCNGLRLLAKEDKKYDILSSFERFNVAYPPAVPGEPQRKGGDVGVVPADIFNRIHFVHIMATHWPLTKRVDEVEQLLRNEPHQFGKTVDAVVIFYHTGLPDVFDYYSQKMDALQADFPNVKFIYVCAGFGGPKYAEANEKAHAFSEKVRERYKGRAPLYDMGKILSDDFRAGHFYCPEYSKDPNEVHPDLPAGETMLAKGFLLVLRDAFRSPSGGLPKPAPTVAATTANPASPKTETLAPDHPDAVAVRAVLDANGLTQKAIEGVSIIEGGRVVGLYLQECGVTELPAAVGKLDALRLIHLYGDRKLPYPFLKKIAPEIGQCLNLEVLLLGQNDLETLPVEITKLQKLTNLAIGDNRLKNLDPGVRDWAAKFDPKGLALQRP